MIYITELLDEIWVHQDGWLRGSKFDQKDRGIEQLLHKRESIAKKHNIQNMAMDQQLKFLASCCLFDVTFGRQCTETPPTKSDCVY